MMNRNYSRPITQREAKEWGDPRETNDAVAMAIHAIADSKRTPAAIWEDPTTAEIDHVKMAVQEYVTRGDFPVEDDNRYAWGHGEPIIL